MGQWVEISRNDLASMQEIKTFLNAHQLEDDSDNDFTLAIYQNNQLLATASKKQNIITCLAVLESHRGEGYLSQLIGLIEARMFKEGHYHFFIYTHPKHRALFTSLGYQKMVSTDHILLLEKGRDSIQDTLENLKRRYQVDDRAHAAIVMNGNPFTKGHRYLVERAVEERKHVLLFVVSEEGQAFPFKERFKLIKEGVRDLPGVTVLETGPYLVSRLSFPTYFIKDRASRSMRQVELDCKLFTTYYKKVFSITSRYVGTEPYCEVTRGYNEGLKTYLPPAGVEVVEVERLEASGVPISASMVRKHLAEGRLDAALALVGEGTKATLIEQAIRGNADV